jgi:hypothetical protein
MNIVGLIFVGIFHFFTPEGVEGTMEFQPQYEVVVITIEDQANWMDYRVEEDYLFLSDQGYEYIVSYAPDDTLVVDLLPAFESSVTQVTMVQQ